MIALRFVWFDIRNGIVGQWLRYLVASAVFVGFALLFLMSCASAGSTYGLEGGPLTLGDHLVNIVAGMAKYPLGSFDLFNLPSGKLPAGWMLVFLLMAYITLSYPYRDLMGMGKHLIIVSGSRTLWWASKCVWVALSVAAFFLVGLATAALWTVAWGGSLTLEVSEVTPIALDFDMGSLLPRPWDIAGIIAVVPAMTVAVCLVQMLLSLFIRPMISYICTMAVLFLSAYFQTPWLVGNYLMAARSECFVTGGMNWQLGLGIAAGMIVVVAVCGGVLFKRMDILDMEQ